MRGRRIIAVDIGGANLKFADEAGRRWAVSFELWHRFADLKDRLSQHIGDCDTILVTMTGELADCFDTRRNGVSAIANAVEGLNLKTFFYGIDGVFALSDQLIADPIRFAATNWHATANAWSNYVDEPTLVVDIGSTTTDLIRIGPHQVLETAVDDRGRLAGQSLVYVGDRRTPVCGLVDSLVDRGVAVACMNEFFSTMDDVRLLLGYVVEDPRSNDTANAMPRTIYGAATRILRMIGSDLDDRSVKDAIELARQVHAAAEQRIADAIDSHSCSRLIWLGSADDLVDLENFDVTHPTTGRPSDPCTAMIDLWQRETRRESD